MLTVCINKIRFVKVIIVLRTIIPRLTVSLHLPLVRCRNPGDCRGVIQAGGTGVLLGEGARSGADLQCIADSGRRAPLSALRQPAQCLFV